MAAGMMGKGFGAMATDVAARLGRVGRKPSGAGGVMTRGVIGEPKWMDEAAQARSGYMRMGAVAGVWGVNRMRKPRSSGKDGLQPHSSGGAMMAPPPMY